MFDHSRSWCSNINFLSWYRAFPIVSWEWQQSTLNMRIHPQILHIVWLWEVWGWEAADRKQHEDNLWSHPPCYSQVCSSQRHSGLLYWFSSLCCTKHTYKNSYSHVIHLGSSLSLLLFTKKIQNVVMYPSATTNKITANVVLPCSRETNEYSWNVFIVMWSNEKVFRPIQRVNIIFDRHNTHGIFVYSHKSVKTNMDKIIALIFFLN